ncbi:Bug family tripartite tricarboxylate transporter substrate binding protein [Acuticoccus sediminis]|uniref:Bug family tripartite tricarboxylate transporter substrate binding protein n=1 Tax=Acuticoccus sediminis TaxID=2184697 RepID=UPI001CFDC853|nr:hypothetical protein [Acuticoccus sediminis]
MRLKLLAAASALAAAIGFGPAQAETDYSGETVTLLINYGAGGSTDIEGRIIAQHLGAHLPGEPNVIVQNMPGGGGNIGSNFLGTSAPKDGTMVGFFTWNPIDQLIKAPGLMIEYNDFAFIAGISHPTIFYMRKDVAPGIEEPTDLLKASGFKAGTMSPTIHQTVRTRLALDLLGIDFDLVSGYRGLKPIDTAMLQDEIQLTNGSLPGFMGSVMPTMVEPGIAIPLFHFDIEDTDGGYHPNPLLSEMHIPTFLDMYHAKFGADAMPEGFEWEALSLINAIMESMYRSILMPPGTDEDAVATMRQAFTDLAADPEFVADYKKTVGVEPRFTFGEEGQAIIERLADLDPDFLAKFTEYVNQQ